MEEIGLEPRFYFRDAGGQGGGSGRTSEFSGEIQLDVISEAVKLETLVTDQRGGCKGRIEGDRGLEPWGTL